jgi:hypothetical protein
VVEVNPMRASSETGLKRCERCGHLSRISIFFEPGDGVCRPCRYREPSWQKQRRAEERETMRAIAPGDRKLCVRCRTFRDEIEFPVILRRRPRPDTLGATCLPCLRAAREREKQ